MQLSQIIQELDCRILSGDPGQPLEVSTACISDMLSDVMAKAVKGSLWITSQTHMNVIAICFFKTLAGVILPDDLIPDDTVLAKAREKEILVLSTSATAFDTAGKLYALGLRGK
ncbi:MAG TPA: DRTGG domain-containing protein [bacterium]|mgnify:CR=1 FL=1|nr:DRTGG domain-containing protein [bacterium]HQG45567.1 DRTGG domain-containing protein [bacterium]HQI49687.1 DRTGG domain-containing protein [bacterium]HQJ65855.1 DRTGG domain-containing protein [bacterium]